MTIQLIKSLQIVENEFIKTFMKRNNTRMREIISIC